MPTRSSSSRRRRRRSPRSSTATKVGWTPTATFINNVSANRLFLLAAAATGANVDGVISSAYTESSTTQRNLPGVKLANPDHRAVRTVAPAELPRATGTSSTGSAWRGRSSYALQHAGKNPTRASLMKALHSLNTSKNPFVYPGIKIQTSAKDNFPIEQENGQVGRRRDRRLAAVRQAPTAASASTADVVVIGGGALGAATAFHLRRLGVATSCCSSGTRSRRAPRAKRQAASARSSRRAEHPHCAALAASSSRRLPTRSRSGQYGYLFLLDRDATMSTPSAPRSHCSIRSACPRRS